MTPPALDSVVWEVDRENGEPPIRLTLGEAIVLLNRLGLSLDEAVRDRPSYEVEALLMGQLAQHEAQRKDRDEVTRVHNPEGVPAPSWVDGLDAEAP